MAPKYRLVYFNSIGKAEPIRFLFALAKVPYTDERLEKEEWAALKEEMPWGVLPVLYEEGKSVPLSQSLTIFKYLGREFKLGGSSSFETAKCDEYVDSMCDVVQEWVALFFETDPAKKEKLGKKIAKEIMPNFLARIEKILINNATSYFVGNSLTYADIYIAQKISVYQDKEILDSYPNVKKHQDLVFQNPEIKKWVESRPKTPF